MNPVFESLRFLSTARVTICEAFETEQIDDLQLAKDFITNEATDYQIMAAIMEGDLPEYKYDTVNESRVWKDFNKMILKNRPTFVESMSVDIIDSMIFNMGPIFEHGLSSQKPILEHLINNGQLQSILELSYGAEEEKVRKDPNLLVPKPNPKLGTNPPKEVGPPAPSKFSRGVKGVGRSISKGAKRVGQTISKGYQAAKAGITKVGTAIKGGATKAIDATTKAAAKHGVTGVTGKGMLAGAGALAGVAALVYGAKKIYDNYMNKAAKSCAGRPDKAQCMQKFKMQAQKAKVSKLQQSIGACKGDPRCKAKIVSKLETEKAKLQDI